MTTPLDFKPLLGSVDNYVKFVGEAYNGPDRPYIDPATAYIDPSTPYNGMTKPVQRSKDPT